VQQFARHGDIRRAHRTSTKTMQDAIQRARACARRNAPMHELFDVRRLIQRAHVRQPILKTALQCR